jgi:hypothetical protein
MIKLVPVQSHSTALSVGDCEVGEEDVGEKKDMAVVLSSVRVDFIVVVVVARGSTQPGRVSYVFSNGGSDY